MRDNASNICLPAEMAVYVTEEEVPPDVLEPARRAAKITGNKATSGVGLYFARPESGDESIERLAYEREHGELFALQALELGAALTEVAYAQLRARGLRLDLGGYRAFYRAPDALVLRTTFGEDLEEEDAEADLPEDAPEEERERLREVVAFAVALSYRRALWDKEGLGKLSRRGKLWSADVDADCALYARAVVFSNRPLVECAQHSTPVLSSSRSLLTTRWRSPGAAAFSSEPRRRLALHP